jgi:hypothetical protein
VTPLTHREQKKRQDGKKFVGSVKPSTNSRTKRKLSEPSDSNDELDTGTSNVNKKLKEDDREIQVEDKVTVYIHIQSPSPPLPRQGSTRSKAKTDVAPVAIRGPCFFHLAQETYDGFMRIIAKELPCKPKLLPTKDISWKYEKPANDPKKPLLNTAGFEAMLMSLKQRRGNRVIVVFMPPPKADDTVSVSATY